jgi:hypothetical protein
MHMLEIYADLYILSENLSCPAQMGLISYRLIWVRDGFKMIY